MNISQFIKSNKKDIKRRLKNSEEFGIPYFMIIEKDCSDYFKAIFFKEYDAIKYFNSLENNDRFEMHYYIEFK